MPTRGEENEDEEKVDAFKGNSAHSERGPTPGGHRWFDEGGHDIGV